MRLYVLAISAQKESWII